MKLLDGLQDNLRGRLRRFDASSVSVKIVAIVLFAVFIPSILITALGLFAIYRVEPAIQESSEFPFRLRLQDLRQKLSVEWKSRMGRYQERLVIETELSGYLRSVATLDDHIRDAFILDAEGFQTVSKESPLWRLEAPEASRELRAAWKLEFQEKDRNLRAARRLYARLAREGAPEVAVEALTGLARVQVASGDWREAIKVLARLVDRYGHTTDDADVPRGLAGLWRIVEICEENDDPVLKARYSDQLKDFLRDVRPWLSPEVVGYYESRLPYALAGESTSAEDTVSLPTSVVLDSAEIQNQLRAAIADVPANKDSGYLTLQRGEESSVVLAFFRGLEEESSRWVFFELEPRAYLRDASIYTARMDMPDPEVVLVGNRGSLLLGAGSPDEGNPPVAIDLPRPFGHLKMNYYRSPDEIPQSLRRLKTQETTSLTWAIAVLVLTILIGIFVTLRSMILEMQVAHIKSDFVSFVSHELKTPLTAVRMFTETLLLGRAGDREGERECVELIDREAARLSRLIEQIIEFSKLEKHQQVFNFSSCTMSEVVDEAVRIFRDRVPEERIDIQVHQAQTMSRIRMDRESMVELILNLLSNAYKYSQGDRKRIVVNMRESIDIIFVDVVDYGVGIAKREQRKIFDKFYRAEDFLTRDVEGTGLGLTYAKYIAKVHNGDIKVSSAVDQGSTFTLEIQKTQVLAE